MAGEKDAGTVKATVKVVYDDQGFDQGKQALANVPETLSNLEQGAGDANTALASLDEQMRKNAESTKALTDVLAPLPKIVEGGITSVSEMAGALGGQIATISETGSAFEALQSPMGTTVAMLQEAAPPMMTIAEHASSLQEQLGGMNESFTQIGDSLSQAVPLLPQFAESMHAVSESFDPKAFGLDTFAENMSVFQDALVNPEPFNLIQGYLGETGQTWQDFASSIGSDNAAMLEGMKQSGTATHDAIGGMAADFQSAGSAINESHGQYQAFTEQFNGLNAAATETNKTMKETGTIAEETGKAVNGIGGGGLFGSTEDVVSPVMGFLNDLMMPMMAVQMVSMAVGAVGQSIYDAAAIAEGPGAHGFGTFTGAVDTMTASTNKAWQSFSEGFGQGALPSIDAINNTNNSGGGIDWGWLGKGLGEEGGMALDLLQIAGGGIVGGAAKILTLNPGNTTGQSWIQGGWEGLQNYWAGFTGAPEPFPSPMTASNLNPMQGQIDQLNAAANNPQYLAAQASYQSAYGKAALAQANWDSSHYSGTYGPSDPMNQVLQAQAANAFGGPGSYGNYQDPNLAWLDNLGLPSYGSGCFPAGTQVLMSDGSTYPIEALQVGDLVLAHDGEKQISAPILALIKPPPKPVYALHFDDGNILTLTDAHPVSTTGGWKSIDPLATEQENPGLSVTALQIGDTIHSIDGTCTLTAIHPLQGKVQVYNIHVSEPNTFYAGGILVHNKVLNTGGGGASMTNSGVGSEQVSLSHTFTANVQWEATNLEKSFTAAAQWAEQNLVHGATAVAQWAEQNLVHGATAVAQWAEQNLVHGVTAAAQWAEQNLLHEATAAAQWADQNLIHPAIATAQWEEQNLMHQATAVAQWAEQGLEHLFTGQASWEGKDLEHMFTATAQWTAQNLNPNFAINPSFTMLAEGASNWSGGPAIVGEAGPEVVESGGRYTLFDEGATLLNLPSGANVYPMKNMASSSVAQFADGTGNNIIPITFGSNSPEMAVVNITHLITLDSRVIAEQTVPHIAPIVRLQSGFRGA